MFVLFYPLPPTLQPAGRAMGREPDRAAKWNQLCMWRRMTTLSGGMMPFGKIEKSLHEGR
jgi:hypothetical protein